MNDTPRALRLVQGRVVIQYRTENLRIVPVFGSVQTRSMCRRASDTFT